MSTALPIGPACRAIREERSLSRSEVARRTDIALSVLQRLEGGSGCTVGSAPDGGTLERIAEALGVSSSVIVRRAEAMEREAKRGCRSRS